MRKYYWYFTAYARKHGLVLVASVVLAVVLFSLVIPTVVSALERKPHRYVGLIGSFSLATLPPEVTQLISSGLTKTEPDGSVKPVVAERWSIEDDAKTYRFLIKDNLTWQDGQPLSPSDINHNLSDVEIITTEEDIVFKLPASFAPFPTVVSKPLVRLVEQRQFMFGSRPMPVGLGLYRITDYRERDQRLESLSLDSPQERVTVRFYLTESDAVLAFKHGEVDELSDITDPQDLTEWSSTKVDRQLRTDRYLAAFFNNDSPLFTKNVRQALSYALRKPQDERRAVGPINPRSWAYLEGGRAYEYDSERGLERLFDGLPTQPLEFTLTTIPSFQQQADQLKQQWEEFGRLAVERCGKTADIDDKDSCQNLNISVTVRVQNFPDTTNYDVLLIGQEIPPDPDQYGLWHSEQSSNFTGYKNTRIDALLEKGRVTTNRTERKALYQEFQQFFLEDAPAVFLEHLTSISVKRR
ncbi:MAG: hypothetical protein COU69_00130 [Candidatus Pacebacteria bacterium CG10_big_fil_rev_8_21_14_0_10_56_10]|nr:MAG: hypothetical protein COU69_00130 [Candidatus Pacebacteria bacterium CG10_big_fil_rev_8_21_14_0_10_56_10]